MSHFFILYLWILALYLLMNENVYNKLKEINFESLVLLLFIVAAGIDIVANDELRKIYTSGNGKENIRKKYILASCLVIVVFAYFAYVNYQKLKRFDRLSKEYQCAYVRFIGSVFALVGEILILAYFINTPEFNDR